MTNYENEMSCREPPNLKMRNMIASMSAALTCKMSPKRVASI